MNSDGTWKCLLCSKEFLKDSSHKCCGVTVSEFGMEGTPQASLKLFLAICKAAKK